MFPKNNKFSNCDKEYSKQNLLDLAVKCGVNIHQRGKKTKTKVQLCNALGHEFHNRKEYEKSFEYLDRCNSLRRANE